MTTGFRTWISEMSWKEILGVLAMGLGIAASVVLLVLNIITPGQMALINAIIAGIGLVYIAGQMI